MSVITWIEAEENKIVHLFEGAETIVETEIDKVILPAAIAVANVAKTIILADTTDIIGSFAGAAGKALEDKVRQVLPLAIADMQLAKQFLDANPVTDDIIAKVVSIGQTLTGDARISFLMEFAGKVAKALADGNLTIQQGFVLTQAYYAELNSIPAVEVSEVNEHPIEGKAQEEAGH